MTPRQMREERIKLFGTYLNTMAAGTFVAGALAPAINIAISPTPSIFPAAYFGLGAIGLSLVTHMLAQLSYGRLRG